MSTGPRVVLGVDESSQIGFGHMSHCWAMQTTCPRQHQIRVILKLLWLNFRMRPLTVKFRTVQSPQPNPLKRAHYEQD